jgi:hypothetical protein
VSQNTSTLVLVLDWPVGWAVHAIDGSVTSGAQDFEAFRFEGRGALFLRFGRWLDGMVHSAGGVRDIYVEEVEPRAGVEAVQLHGGQLAMLLCWCEQHDTPCLGLLPATFAKRRGRNRRSSAAGATDANEAQDGPPKHANETRALAMMDGIVAKHGAPMLKMPPLEIRRSLLVGTLKCEAKAHLEHAMRLLDLADIQNEEAAVALAERFPSMRELLFPGSPKCH